MENLINVYHFKEKELYTVYSKNKQILTYNLIILIDYLRNNRVSLDTIENLKFYSTLRALIINDQVNLFEKKYLIDFLVYLILNDQIRTDKIRSDIELTKKIKSLSLDPPVSLNLKEELSNRKGISKFNTKKPFLQACNELFWLLSKDFQRISTVASADFEKAYTIQSNLPDFKNILISHSSDSIDDAVKLKNDLENKNFVTTLDPYDSSETNETVEIDRIKKLVDENSIFIIMVSDKYKKSKYALFLSKFAFVKQKTIMPLIVEKRLKLSDWLLDVIDKQYFDDTSKLSFVDRSAYILNLIKTPTISMFKSSIYSPIANKLSYIDLSESSLSDEESKITSSNDDIAIFKEKSDIF